MLRLVPLHFCRAALLQRRPIKLRKGTCWGNARFALHPIRKRRAPYTCEATAGLLSEWKEFRRCWECMEGRNLVLCM